MREDWIVADRRLRAFLDYKYLTAGEVGNMLIRLQACVRSLEKLRPKAYVKELQGEPRFVVYSFYTKGSAELAIAIAGLVYSVALQPFWNDYAKLVWRRLIGATYFFVKGGLPGQREAGLPPEEFKTELQRGSEDDLRVAVNLRVLDEEQTRKLADFVYSVIYPTNYVTLEDDETELVIIRRRKR